MLQDNTSSTNSIESSTTTSSAPKKKATQTPFANRRISDLASKVGSLQGWAIGVDLGGQNMRGAWVSTKGQLFDPIKWETKVSEGKEKVLGRMAQLVEELLKNPPPGCIPSQNLLGVGFGIPGILHLKKGLVIQSPQFPDWKRFAVYEKLKKKIKFPVFVDNDANASAIGEKVFGACKSYDDFVYVTVGAGIGGGLFLNGDIYHGSMGMSGEVGHITVDPQGAPESTGNRGSVNLFASAVGLEKIISDLKEKHPGISANNPEDLYELWKRGNKIPEFEAIDKVFDDMGNALGIMLANVVNTLDPQAICFAGGLTHAWKAFSRKMIQITMERSYVARHNKLRILTTTLMKNSNFMEAGVVGAASLVFIDALRRLPVEVKQPAPQKVGPAVSLKAAS